MALKVEFSNIKSGEISYWISGEATRKDGNFLYFDSGRVISISYNYPKHQRLYIVRSIDQFDNKPLNLPYLSGCYSILLAAVGAGVKRVDHLIKYMNKHEIRLEELTDNDYLKINLLVKNKTFHKELVHQLLLLH